MTIIKIQCKHYNGNMARCTNEKNRRKPKWFFGTVTKKCPLVFDKGTCELREVSKRPPPPAPMRTAVNS